MTRLGGFWGVDVGEGEELIGGEVFGHGVFGAGDFFEGADGVADLVLGADFGLEFAEFFAGLEDFLANVRGEEIVQGLFCALEVFAEHVGVGVAEGDGVERSAGECGSRLICVCGFHECSPFYEKSVARRRKSVAGATPRCGGAKRGFW